MLVPGSNLARTSIADTYCHASNAKSYNSENAAVEACYRTQSCIGVTERSGGYTIASSSDCFSTDGVFVNGQKLIRSLTGMSNEVDM